MDRRDFLKTAGAGSVMATVTGAATSSQPIGVPAGDRALWIAALRRIADPTGSLYLCAVALLPLGWPASDPFWSAPSQPWTAVKAWSGQAFPIDHALAT